MPNAKLENLKLLLFKVGNVHDTESTAKVKDDWALQTLDTRKKIVIFTFSLVNFCNYACYSLLGPFFPFEVSVSAFKVGLVGYKSATKMGGFCEEKMMILDLSDNEIEKRRKYRERVMFWILMWTSFLGYVMFSMPGPLLPLEKVIYCFTNVCYTRHRQTLGYIPEGDPLLQKNQTSPNSGLYSRRGWSSVVLLSVTATPDITKLCVAGKKGTSQTTVGFIFSCFEFVIFVTSPIFGYFLTKIGPKFLFVSGIFICGCCSVSFG
ncbi:hypothetical protein LOTGIDRAFT_169591 [Lottia gigantea]|uniref:Uncharacterized protein n=1 Tax=Lottia gigantea TaxID=225164 RepID=V3ZQM2_LOTGI|nr:hypothetical protein LOTGIDRAFT_169591 [Lottia gigantea]ESO83181.1 hypothetical protein LOTGIDRAFT_169591 [Lottia gigantea]